MRRLAEESGSPISAVLFGALAASGALPFSRQQFEEAIRCCAIGVESSLRAFAAGFAACNGPAAAAAPEPPTPRGGPWLGRSAARVESGFPAAACEILFAGVARLADYQDEAYALNYLDRLEKIRDLDAQHGDGCFRLLREAARHLALWMSYEDAIRVADLKIRRERFERVSRDVRAQPGQIVQIHEFLHPGAPP